MPPSAEAVNEWSAAQPGTAKPNIPARLIARDSAICFVMMRILLAWRQRDHHSERSSFREIVVIHPDAILRVRTRWRAVRSSLRQCGLLGRPRRFLSLGVRI